MKAKLKNYALEKYKKIHKLESYRGKILLHASGQAFATILNEGRDSRLARHFSEEVITSCFTWIQMYPNSQPFEYCYCDELINQNSMKI